MKSPLADDWRERPIKHIGSGVRNRQSPLRSASQGFVARGWHSAFAGLAVAGGLLAILPAARLVLAPAQVGAQGLGQTLGLVVTLGFRFGSGHGTIPSGPE
jgi:hypothetical protein